MCGIFGCVDISMNSEKWIPPGEFRGVMAHRGPDDYGSEVISEYPHVVLTHNRLSIIDLSPLGGQPMSNEDGTVWLTFNGEIYNYQELRHELIKAGHGFKSNTDTEVIIHLYEQDGVRCLEKLNGMFAFAIWDKRNQSLFLARDRLGVKPLVYFVGNEICIFSSEIRALRYHPRIDWEMDWEALELYFTFNFIPAPWTIFKGVRKLPPAHYLLFNRDGAKLEKYWEVRKSSQGVQDLEEAAERLREVISDATKIRLYSDVPLGAFLSGGIDSSIVVANMARHSSQRIKTYFLGYEEDKLFDETAFARSVAQMYDTEHCEIRLSEQKIQSILPEVLSSFDEPFADSSALPTYVVSREIRRHVAVAMSGDGGDEIFGGYRRYLGLIYVDLLLKIPKSVRENILIPFINSLPDSKGNRYLEIIRRLKIFINGASENEADRHYGWMALFPDKERKSILREDIVSMFTGIGKSYVLRLMESNFDCPVNQALLVDFKFLLPSDMLNKVDWMSMKNSLEVRSPLLDFRVAELAFQLPGSFKVKPTKLKFILRYAFKDWLPESLWTRRKQGFEIPVGEWFKRDPKLQKMFWELVNSNGKCLNLRGVNDLFEEHVRNHHDNSHKLWAIFVFCWWLQGDYGIDPF